MQLTVFLTALAGASAANASIALGQQYRNGEINHNIAYQYGTDPCANDVSISLTGQERCNIPFTIDNTEYKLQNCGNDKFGVYHTNGDLYGKCESIKQHRSNCKGGVHDVLTFWVCGN